MQATGSSPIVVRKPNREETLVLWLRGGVLIGIVLSIIVPFLPLFFWSFSLRWFYPALAPTEYSLRAWEYLASPSSRVLSSLLTSLLLSSTVTVLATIIAIPAGLHVTEGQVVTIGMRPEHLHLAGDGIDYW